MQNIMIGIGFGIMLMVALIAIFDLRPSGQKSNEEIVREFFRED